MYETTDRPNETVIGDVEAAVIAGVETTKPQQLGDEDSTLYVVRNGNGNTVIHDTREWDDRYLAHPRRKTGQYAVTQVDSFVDYLDRHGNDQTEVTVNTASASLRAVIDSHGLDEAGHEQHVLGLQFPKSDQWGVWLGANGKAMRQRDFAEFIEDNLVDVIDPAGADMLEIVSSLSATTKATFHSAHRLSDGSTELEWTQEVNAKAGTTKSGKVEIPGQFKIAIPVFRGGSVWKIEARFRYRVNDGVLTMSYHLTRPADLLDAAFTKEVEAVRERIGGTYPIYVNCPQRGAPSRTGGAPLPQNGGSGVRTADRGHPCPPGVQEREPAHGRHVRGREGAPGVEAGDGVGADPVPGGAGRHEPVQRPGGADDALPDAAPEEPLPHGPVLARAEGLGADPSHAEAGRRQARARRRGLPHP
jgi:uncharacterized protein YfdQ (DUF2303 family)